MPQWHTQGSAAVGWLQWALKGGAAAPQPCEPPWGRGTGAAPAPLALELCGAPVGEWVSGLGVMPKAALLPPAQPLECAQHKSWAAAPVGFQRWQLLCPLPPSLPFHTRKCLSWESCPGRCRWQSTQIPALSGHTSASPCSQS